MGRKSDIEWTKGDDGQDGGTWEPVLGCESISPGCVNCYAAELVGRRLGRNPATPRYHGLAIIDQHSNRAKWTKKVALQPDHLGVPLHWRNPLRAFVCSRSDLFHEDVPFEYIAAVHGVMAAASSSTFMLLTKRAERMKSFYTWWTSLDDPLFVARFEASRAAAHLDKLCDIGALEQRHHGHDRESMLANVQVGVSVEYAAYKHRLEALYETPGISKRWASFEPLLGDLGDLGPNLSMLDWGVIGGESGKHARQCDIGWIEGALRQLQRAGVRPFVKQLGAYVTLQVDDWRDGVVVNDPRSVRIRFKHKKAADMAEWEERRLHHLCVRETI